MGKGKSVLPLVLDGGRSARTRERGRSPPGTAPPLLPGETEGEGGLQKSPNSDTLSQMLPSQLGADSEVPSAASVRWDSGEKRPCDGSGSGRTVRHSPAPSGILLSAGSRRREELSGARPDTPSPPAPRPLLGSGAAPLRASSYLRRSGPAPSPAAGCSPRRRSGAGGSCAPSCSSPGRTSAWWGTAAAALRLRAPGAASVTSESPAGRRRGGDLRGGAEPPLRAGGAGREGPLAGGGAQVAAPPRPTPGCPERGFSAPAAAGAAGSGKAAPTAERATAAAAHRAAIAGGGGGRPGAVSAAPARGGHGGESLRGRQR